MALISLMSRMAMEADIVTDWCGICGPSSALAAIICHVDPLLSFARACQQEMVALIRRFVECESPSDDAASVTRFGELVADTVGPDAKVKTHPGGRYGKILVAELKLA